MGWDSQGEYGAPFRYARDYQKLLSIIRKVFVREKGLFTGRKVSGRIVSIDCYYTRPIMRGKETKPVEFGAKVNNIHTDGISFIEYVSFKALMRGIRMRDCVRLRQKLIAVRVRCAVADSIYASSG